MAGKLKLLVCCGNGVGASMMVKLNVEKITRRMGLGVREVHHCAVPEGKSAAGQYDIVLYSKNFVSMFADVERRDTKIVGLKSAMPAKEIEEGLAAVINK